MAKVRENVSLGDVIATNDRFSTVLDRNKASQEREDTTEEEREKQRKKGRICLYTRSNGHSRTFCIQRNIQREETLVVPWSVEETSQICPLSLPKVPQ